MRQIYGETGNKVTTKLTKKEDKVTHYDEVAPFDQSFQNQVPLRLSAYDIGTGVFSLVQDPRALNSARQKSGAHDAQPQRQKTCPLHVQSPVRRLPHNVAVLSSLVRVFHALRGRVQRTRSSFDCNLNLLVPYDQAVAVKTRSYQNLQPPTPPVFKKSKQEQNSALYIYLHRLDSYVQLSFLLFSFQFTGTMGQKNVEGRQKLTRLEKEDRDLYYSLLSQRKGKGNVLFPIIKKIKNTKNCIILIQRIRYTSTVHP